MDLRLRIKSESEIHSQFKQLQKDNEWTGQAAAMHIFRSYFNKPVLATEETAKPKEVAVVKVKTEKRFVKPSLIEIQQEFEITGSYTCLYDGDSFFNHYESNGSKVGKNSMKNWKATVAQWHNRNKDNLNEKNKPKRHAAADSLDLDSIDY